MKALSQSFKKLIVLAGYGSQMTLFNYHLRDFPPDLINITKTKAPQTQPLICAAIVVWL